MTRSKAFLVILMISIISLPLALLVTIVTHPLWRWFEEITGIESFGHSGPAAWCYGFDYLVIVVILVVVTFRLIITNRPDE